MKPHEKFAKFCAKTFFLENDFFFENGHHLEKLHPWALALASSIPVFSLERVCPRKVRAWPWIFFVSLASKVVYSTPPL